MASSVKKTVAFVAGKSGGHIIPCITLMQQQYATYTSIFFTTDNPLDNSIIQKSASGITHYTLPLGLSYTNVWKAFPRLIWRLIASCIKSIQILRTHNTQRIITTSGLIAIPVCLAAYFLGIPIDIYELNAIPGKTTRFLSRLATHIFVCFKETMPLLSRKKCLLTSYPINIQHTQPYDRTSILTTYDLDLHMPILLVLGGSQGSLSLNNAVTQTLRYRSDPIQVMHQTGATDTTDWKQWYNEQHIKAHVFAYTQDIASLLSVADVIVCRAGAGTLFEIASFNKPCIIIPLEGLGDNHQLANAHAMHKQYNRCVILKQKDIQQNVQLLMRQIEQLLSSNQPQPFSSHQKNAETKHSI